MKYKNIKSVAHNLGHSFLSDMNAVTSRGKYEVVPDILFEQAAERRIPGLEIDFLSRQVVPPEMASDVTEQSVVNYGRELFRLCEAQGVDAASIKAATLTIEFDYTRQRRSPYFPDEPVQEFSCVVAILDDRGVTHIGRPTNWWRA